MNYILVPFLLGIRLSPNEDCWQKGPEYTFAVTIGTVSNLYEDHGRYMGSSVSTWLKCRPREPDRLQCRFENPKIAKLTPDRFEPEAVVPPENTTYSEYGFGKMSFEMKFNEKGIESYAFDEEDPPVDLKDMYRLVANHLSVWSGIVNVRKIDQFENTTVGECFVGYEVSWRKLSNGTMNGNYELIWLPDMTMLADHGFVITKKLHLNNCVQTPIYKFGTRHHYGVVPVESIKNLTSSTGHIFISHSNFTSESVNTVNVYDLNGKMIGSVIDRIRLTLVSVDPPRSEMKKILNSTLTSSTLHEDQSHFLELHSR